MRRNWSRATRISAQCQNNRPAESAKRMHHIGRHYATLLFRFVYDLPPLNNNNNVSVMEASASASGNRRRNQTKRNETKRIGGYVTRLSAPGGGGGAVQRPRDAGGGRVGSRYGRRPRGSTTGFHRAGAMRWQRAVVRHSPGSLTCPGSADL